MVMPKLCSLLAGNMSKIKKRKLETKTLIREQPAFKIKETKYLELLYSLSLLRNGSGFVNVCLAGDKKKNPWSNLQISVYVVNVIKIMIKIENVSTSWKII